MKHRLLLSLLFLLAICLPLYADTSYVNVEKEDWEQIQTYIINSQTQLKTAQTELITLKTDLETSLKQAETLRKYSESTMTQLKKAKTWNKIFIGGLVVSVSINIVALLLMLR